MPASEALPPAALDPVACARQVRRGLAQVDAPWLNQEVARRLASKLAWIKLQPASWVEWQPGWGGGADLVAAQYPQALHGLLSPHAQRLGAPDPGQQGGRRTGGLRAWQQAWKQWWAGEAQRVWHPADAEQAPWGASGAQMLWANMSLHVTPDLPGTLKAWSNQLAPQGFLMCSGLGPDTARELRAVYASMGWGLPTVQFIDMHDLGDALVQAGFAEPVMDMERIQLTWGSPEALLAELRTWGGNAALGRFAGCRGRRWQAAWLKAVGEGMRDADGRIRMTVELVYGHAIQPEARAPMLPESKVSLADMRRMVRRREP